MDASFRLRSVREYRTRSNNDDEPTVSFVGYYMKASKNIALRAIVGSILAASGATAMYARPALAADDSSAAAKASDLGLDEIVVTAAAGDKTRIRSSISVTDVDQAAIEDFSPRSEAEVLRLIPGIRAEDTAGPGGNSNITVRGLPIVTGGSEFVQLQEDGLPTVLFGDMNFGNNDYWLRYDTNVSRVEAVRGGSASTLASQAPGAVINYITDTGEREGGLVGISRAINYTENKLDFNYGGPLSDTVRFHVGGFVKDGNGPTNIDYNAEHGYQIKANLTKDFADGKGYIRLNLKRLDDTEPTYTNMPSLATVNGGTIGGFKAYPTFDPRSQSNQSIYNQQFQVLNYDGTLGTMKMQGIHAVATAFGGEFHREFNDNFTVDDKFRYTIMSGTFATQFLNVAATSSVLGSTVNGQTVGSIRYANGPSQGQTYTGAFLNNNPNIDTNMSNMGNWVNDLALAGKFDIDSNKLSARVGWFHMVQNIAQDWHVNPSYSELSGHNPAQLDLFSVAGTQLTAAGQAGFNNNWGNCCARQYDLTYTNDAPYLSLNDSLLEDKLDLDASVRIDQVKAQGWALGGVAGPSVSVKDNLGTAVLPSLIAGGAQEQLNYTVHYTSWSAGALYAITPDFTVFGRASRGGRFNGDRQILSGNFNTDGSLNAAGASTAVNVVTQQEGGIKNRGHLWGASYNVEAVYFRAQTSDDNYDLTNQTYYNNVYHSSGLELDGSARYGDFVVSADVTYTKAQITASTSAPGQVGNTPLATPKYIYRLSPAYDMGLAAIGFTIDGQSSAYTDNSDAYSIEGQTFVNLFAKVRPLKGLEIGLNVNNLFDTIGYRGRGSLVNITPTSGVFQNSAVLGRTVVGTVRYRF